MAAPLPPPASAPINAPAPAPPPMNPADLLPLPFTELITADVWMFWSLPLMATESSLTSRSAPPLKCPMAFAATTVPWAEAPRSTRVLPSTVTGSATVAEKPCPAWLDFELSVSPRRTVMTVPAGMVTAAAGTVFLADVPPELAALELSVVLAGVPVFWLQPSTSTKTETTAKQVTRKDFIFTPKPDFVSNKARSGQCANGCVPGSCYSGSRKWALHERSEIRGSGLQSVRYVRFK